MDEVKIGVDRERVVDVPARLAAQVRLFDTGHNRETQTVDAHSVAMVAVRTPGLRELAADGELEALRMLADRRDGRRHHPGARLWRSGLRG